MYRQFHASLANVCRTIYRRLSVAAVISPPRAHPITLTCTKSLRARIFDAKCFYHLFTLFHCAAKGWCCFITIFVQITLNDTNATYCCYFRCSEVLTLNLLTDYDSYVSSLQGVKRSIVSKK